MKHGAYPQNHANFLVAHLLPGLRLGMHAALLRCHQPAGTQSWRHQPCAAASVTQKGSKPHSQSSGGIHTTFLSQGVHPELLPITIAQTSKEDRSITWPTKIGPGWGRTPDLPHTERPSHWWHLALPSADVYSEGSIVHTSDDRSYIYSHTISALDKLCCAGAAGEPRGGHSPAAHPAYLLPAPLRPAGKCRVVMAHNFGETCLAGAHKLPGLQTIQGGYLAVKQGLSWSSIYLVGICINARPEQNRNAARSTMILPTVRLWPADPDGDTWLCVIVGHMPITRLR